jgi:hypothetical protein
MTKTRLIGWTAMVVCVLGYVGGAAILIAGKMDYLEMTPAIVAGGLALVIGEIGLWVAAACLGFTIFKKRKALIDRVLGRNKPTEPRPTA